MSLLQSRPPANVSIVWTNAHREYYEAAGAQDVWCIFHNNKSEEAAKLAGKAIPSALLQSQQNLLQRIQLDVQANIDAATGLRQVMDEIL